METSYVDAVVQVVRGTDDARRYEAMLLCFASVPVVELEFFSEGYIYEINDHVLILSESLMMLLDGPDDESDNEDDNEDGDIRDAAGDNKSNQSESDESEQSESDEGPTIQRSSRGRMITRNKRYRY